MKESLFWNTEIVRFKETALIWNSVYPTFFAQKKEIRNIVKNASNSCIIVLHTNGVLDVAALRRELVRQQQQDLAERNNAYLFPIAVEWGTKKSYLIVAACDQVLALAFASDQFIVD